MTHAPAPRRRSASATQEVEEFDNNLQPPPPDGGWGWVVVFASFMIHIVTDGVTYSFGVFYNEFLKYFNESRGATSWIASILVGVTLCSGPVSSSFVNKYGCRVVTIAGSILASACMIASVFAPNVLTLCFTIGLGTGFGFGLIYLPAIVSVTCYFEKYRSLATGIAVCGSGLGTFLFAPLTEYLITEYGWRGAMLIIAALVLNCIILGALFRPVPDNREVQVVKRSDSSSAIVPHPAAAKTCLVIENICSDHELQVKTSLHRPRSIGHLLMPHSGKTPHKTSSHTGGSEIARLALSQPVLLTTSSTSDARFRPTFGSQALRKSSGIMYRRDVFYRGSLHNIPNHRSNPWLPQDAKHSDEALQLMEINGTKHSREDDYDDDNEKRIICGCVPCSKETVDTLVEMLDFTLLKDPIFILFTVSNFCTSIGFNIPYVYLVVYRYSTVAKCDKTFENTDSVYLQFVNMTAILVACIMAAEFPNHEHAMRLLFQLYAQAEERNLTTSQASMLISVIGIANLIGRIILGYVSDKPWINRLLVYNVCLTICGFATAFSAFCYDFYSFVIYASVFGFTIGAYVGLTSVILVDLLGLDRLTNAFGLLLLFQGIASFLGPPIAGWLYDGLKSYDPGFYVAGVTIAISGIMLFAIPPLQTYLLRRKTSNISEKSASQHNGNANHASA